MRTRAEENSSGDPHRIKGYKKHMRYWGKVMHKLSEGNAKWIFITKTGNFVARLHKSYDNSGRCWKDRRYGKRN